VEFETIERPRGDATAWRFSTFTLVQRVCRWPARVSPCVPLLRLFRPPSPSFPRCSRASRACGHLTLNRPLHPPLLLSCQSWFLLSGRPAPRTISKICQSFSLRPPSEIARLLVRRVHIYVINFSCLIHDFLRLSRRCWHDCAHSRHQGRPRQRRPHPSRAW
jgi:hypothetical protein